MSSTTPTTELVACLDGLDDPAIQEIRRTAGVGASEIAAVLGVSSWTSERELYALKRGEIPPPRENRGMNWGKRLEHVVVARRAESAATVGLSVVRPNRIYRSTRCRAMTCSPDALEFPIGTPFDLDAPCGTVCLDDAKTADANDKRAWRTAIPPQYVLQLHHGAYVLGAHEMALDVLFGGNDYQRYTFEADEELGEMLAAAAVDFMARVEEGRPPEPQPTHSGTADLLAQLYPGVPKLQRPLSVTTAKKLLDLRALQAQAKWVDEEVTRLRNEVRMELGDAVEGTFKVGKRDMTLVSWSAENDESVSISIPELRKLHPHLYRMVERRVGRPAGRSTRINLRGKAIDAAAEAILEASTQEGEQ